MEHPDHLITLTVFTHDKAVLEPGGDVVPCGHFIGVVVPFMGQYVFAGHDMHPGSIPVGEYVPGGHFGFTTTNCVHIIEPTVDVVPGGQGIGFVIPSLGHIVFSGHEMHPG